MNGNRNNSELDDYVSKQLENYYGKDIVNDVSRSAPPSPPSKKPGRGFTAAAVLCAVVFLTGAVMFTGVIFTNGIPASHSQKNDTSSSQIAVSSSELSSSETENSNAVSSVISSSETESSRDISSVISSS